MIEMLATIALLVIPTWIVVMLKKSDDDFKN